MSYSPTEFRQTLFVECTWLQGAIISSVAYGMVFTLFVLCFNLLVRSHARTTKDCRDRTAPVGYTCIMFVWGRHL
ncbi:hypothetical protein BDQ17DRAFT_537533 [Cyathus striatus]|nr:hypothetical protein BDQ17DRAFT_537533 [Cyathus striatus]